MKVKACQRSGRGGRQDQIGEVRDSSPGASAGHGTARPASFHATLLHPGHAPPPIAPHTAASCTGKM
jgi:hypothetical protein